MFLLNDLFDILLNYLSLVTKSNTSGFFSRRHGPGAEDRQKAGCATWLVAAAFKKNWASQFVGCRKLLKH